MHIQTIQNKYTQDQNNVNCSTLCFQNWQVHSTKSANIYRHLTICTAHLPLFRDSNIPVTSYSNIKIIDTFSAEDSLILHWHCINWNTARLPWFIGVDFFLKKANSSGVRIFIQTLFLCVGCPRKRIFSVIISSKLLKFYTPGVGNTVHTKGRIWKILKPRAALIGRAKKRSTCPQTSCFHHWRSVKRKKKFQRRAKQKEKKVFGLIHDRSSFISAHRPHKMIARAALCPPLVYTVIQVLVYYLHFYTVTYLKNWLQIMRVLPN